MVCFPRLQSLASSKLRLASAYESPTSRVSTPSFFSLRNAFRRGSATQPPPDAATVKQQQQFASAWNSIVDDLRERDLLSDIELKHLRYEEVLLPARAVAAAPVTGGVGGGDGVRSSRVGSEEQQVLLLPRMVAAGKVMDAKEQRSKMLVQTAVMDSAWDLVVWVLTVMNVNQRGSQEERSTAEPVDIQGYGNAVGLAERGRFLVKHVGLLRSIKEALEGQKVSVGSC